MPATLTSSDIRRLIVFTVVLLLGITIAFLTVWYAWRVLFLAFAALLLAIVLDSFTEWMQARMHLSRRAAYYIVLGTILVICGLAAWLLFPRLANEAAQIVTLIAISLEEAKRLLQQQTWGHYLLEFLERESSRINAVPKLATAATTLADAVAGLIIVLVVGSYAALDPKTYIWGILRIFPENRREQVQRVGSEVIHTLRWWLLGQLVPMVFLGLLTILGLWL